MGAGAAGAVLGVAACGSGSGNGNTSSTDAGADRDASSAHDAATADSGSGADAGADVAPEGGGDVQAGPEAGADGGACAPPATTQGAACDQCIVSNCDPAWCACKGDTASVDDAGVPGCLSYVACVEECVAKDAGTPTACLQQICATSAYTTPEQHEGQSFIDCTVQYCSTPCGQ